MRVSTIVAAAENNAIGKDGAMPWHLPDDLKFFKTHTSGHPVIMGRKTFDTLKKPLPGRTNIVLTRDKNYKADGVEVYHSIDKAVERAKQIDDDEIFIIGGAKIYEQALDYYDRVYLTRVHSSFEADAFFPELNMNDWQIVEETFHPADDRHNYSFTFFILDRA